MRTRRRVMDYDYVYEAHFLELTWHVRTPKGRGNWPTWTKSLTGYSIVMDKWTPPGAPISASALAGNWSAAESAGRHATFMLAIDSSSG